MHSGRFRGWQLMPLALLLANPSLGWVSGAGGVGGPALGEDLASGTGRVRFNRALTLKHDMRTIYFKSGRLIDTPNLEPSVPYCSLSANAAASENTRVAAGTAGRYANAEVTTVRPALRVLTMSLSNASPFTSLECRGDGNQTWTREALRAHFGPDLLTFEPDGVVADPTGAGSAAANNGTPASFSEVGGPTIVPSPVSGSAED